MIDIAMKISGMTCQGCATSIQKALRTAPGVHSASVSYPEGTALVSAEADKTVVSELTGIVASLGYETETIEPPREATRAEGNGAETAGGTKPLILVIGAGSAAFSAAITAAEGGARVVMIGEGVIGGTCVNVGCVPSKTLIRAMESVHRASTANRFNGIEGSGRVVDWAAVVRHKQALVDDLRKKKYEDLLAAYPNIRYRRARARFTGEGLNVEADGEIHRPDKVILATGARAATPAIDGIESVEALDSTRALELEELPESLVIIGGGYIGCELGQMFARAGTRVAICFRSRLLPDAEPEVGEALEAFFHEEGIEIHHVVGYRKVERRGGRIALHCRTQTAETVIEAERLLAATSRAPNVEDLGLDTIGVELNELGGVAVNEHMRTSNPNVYAAGDVTGRDMFVYMAAYGAKLAARHALEGDRRAYDNAAMPSVTFTDPQAAAVGLTEAEAKARGYAAISSVVKLDAVPRHIAARDTRGFIKLVADAKTDRLLGAAILAPEAGDSIQTIVMALKAGMTTVELGETIFPYLTAVEGLKLAAQGFKKDVAKLSCCAG